MLLVLLPCKPWRYTAPGIIILCRPSHAHLRFGHGSAYSSQLGFRADLELFEGFHGFKAPSKPSKPSTQR